MNARFSARDALARCELVSDCRQYLVWSGGRCGCIVHVLCIACQCAVLGGGVKCSGVRLLALSAFAMLCVR
jgi:hypothetical protein